MRGVVTISVALVCLCTLSCGNQSDSPARPWWPGHGALPAGVLPEGVVVSPFEAAEPDSMQVEPAIDKTSLWLALGAQVHAGACVQGSVRLSCASAVKVEVFLARHGPSPWEATSKVVDVGPGAQTIDVAHCFPEARPDARLQIAVRKGGHAPLIVHQASIALAPDDRCQATVERISTLPDPATADYADCLDVLQVRFDPPCGELSEALIAVQTMRDRSLTPAASIRAGDMLQCTLTPWDDVPEKTQSLRMVQDMDAFHLPLLLGTKVHFRSGDGIVVTRKAGEGNVTQPSGASLGPSPTAAQRVLIEQDLARIKAVAAEHGGWQAWARTLKPFQKHLQSLLVDDLTVLDDDWIVSRGRAFWLLGARLLQHAEDPLYLKAMQTVVQTAAALNAHGIDLIVVPVPTRLEVEPDRVGGEAGSIVAPHRLRWMEQLLEAGVEVVDVLPAMQAARAGATRDDPVVFEADAHWAGRGLEAAAGVIAQRLARYATDQPYGEPDLKPRSVPTLDDLLLEVDWTDTDRWSDRKVDIREVVNPPRSTGPESVLLMADSYGTVFSKYHAGFTSHLAAGSGLPTHRITKDGGAPAVPQTLARDGGTALEGRSVVIWLFVARYLPDHMGWRPSSAAALGDVLSN